MAKRVQSVSFKNAYFQVKEDEINGGKKIWIVELTRDDEIITDFDEVLDMFGDEEGISLNIKIEKGLNE